MRKILLFLVIALFGGLWASWSAEEVTITFWHHEAPAHRVAAFQEVINRFEAEHPNIKVKQIIIPWGDAWPKTLSAIAAGTTPDFEFDIPDLNLAAFEAGGIIPLDNLVAELEAKYNFIDSQLKMYQHDGHIWGVPIWTMPFVLIYRPSYLRQYGGTLTPPRTWDELLSLAKKLTVDTNGDGAVDIYGIGLAAALNLLTQEQAWAFMAPANVYLFDEQGHVVFESPEAIRAVRMYEDLFKYSPPGATGWSWGEMELNFAAGKIAMMPYFGGLQKRFYEMGNFDLAAAPLPIPKGGVRKTLTYPNAVMVFKTAQKRGVLNEVEEFIKFMLRPDINAILTAVQEPGSFVPVTQAAMLAEEYWGNKVINRFREMNETIVNEIQYGTLYGFQHGVVNYCIGRVIGANVLAEVIQRAVTGAMTPEEAVEWGHQQMVEMCE